VSITDQLRVEVARARQLPDSAVGFLTGESLPEIEESADRLSRVFASHAQPEPEHAQDLIAAARTAQAEHRARVLAAFSGRPQPRDDLGRYASRSFDGGARQPVPAASRDPLQDHNRLVNRAAALSRTLGRSDF
jgi:hypothetical protein